MLVCCTVCRTTLQVPPGANSIICTICNAVSLIANHHFPPPSPYYRQYAPPPSPYQHAAPGPPPGVYGKKRAVICGVTYRNSDRPVRGAINDANCMKHLLLSRFNFPTSSILMLTEDETDPLRLPTKHNIFMALQWLIRGCQFGDSLVFYFSGHGAQERDHMGDELDGFNETLCPMDHRTNGMIVDDDINRTIVNPIPSGVKLHAIIDACHSGTVLDLPFFCRMDEKGIYMWEDHRPRSGMWKGTKGGQVICFSACDDHQISTDTMELSKVTDTGAMTYSFIHAIERGHGATYGSILNSVRSSIHDTNRDLARRFITCPMTTVFSAAQGLLKHRLPGFLTRGNLAGGAITHMLAHNSPFCCGCKKILQGQSPRPGQFGQVAQLTSSEMFDVYTMPFTL